MHVTCHMVSTLVSMSITSQWWHQQQKHESEGHSTCSAAILLMPFLMLPFVPANPWGPQKP